MLDTNYIREIADILIEKNLGEIEIDGAKLRIKAKEDTKVLDNTTSYDEKNVVITPKVVMQEEKEETLFEVKASIGGKFFTAPYNNGPDFIFEGKKIKTGDTICMIETSKGKHQIPSPVDGEVVEILATSSQIVEFGKPIIKIKR